MGERAQLFCHIFNPLNAELNPICHFLALLGVHHFLHVSRIRVKSLTLGLLMSYIYMEHLFLMFRDHTQRRTTVGRTPLDEWQLVADTFTWEHTTLTTDKYPCPRWDSNPRSQQASGECRVLSGRGLCDELITRPEEFYRLWCVVVCDLDNLKNEEVMTRVGSQRHSKKKYHLSLIAN